MNGGLAASLSRRPPEIDRARGIRTIASRLVSYQRICVSVCHCDTPVQELDPDEFFEQEARREKILRMQDKVRPGRTTPIAVRFDRFTLKRLRVLAALRNTGYQTLLKEFVVERLYEEEKREGIIDA